MESGDVVDLTPHAGDDPSALRTTPLEGEEDDVDQTGISGLTWTGLSGPGLSGSRPSYPANYPVGVQRDVPRRNSHVRDCIS